MTFQRTVLITGGTSGLGYQCALALGRQHPTYLIVLASRTDSTFAATKLNSELSSSSFVYLPLDLSSLANVRAFAQDWPSKSFPPIQALLLNAGLQFPNGMHQTADGFEATFGVNHVGHALLYHLMHPYLSEDARIVVTSSGTHDPVQKTGMPPAVYTSAEELAHPRNPAGASNGQQRYTSSKLANMLWTYALATRLARSSTDRAKTVVAFDPGLMPGTGLARESSGVMKFLWLRILPNIIPLLRLIMFKNIHTTQESGQALAWVATRADLAGRTGIYFEGKTEIRSSKTSYDEARQRDIWEWTIGNIGLNQEQRSMLHQM